MPLGYDFQCTLFSSYGECNAPPWKCYGGRRGMVKNPLINEGVRLKKSSAQHRIGGVRDDDKIEENIDL